jgi:hypothetical protein
VDQQVFPAQKTCCNLRFSLMSPRKTADFQFKGGWIMKLVWITSFWSKVAHSPVGLLLFMFVASVTLIMIIEWFSSLRAADKESSIRELERLWTLKDCRDNESYWQQKWM